MSTETIRVCLFALLGVMLFVSGCAAPVDEAAAAAQAQADQELATLRAQAAQAASNKQVVQTFLGLFMSGQWDDFDQVIATDCVLHEPGGVDIVGLEAMKSLWQVAYAALKDMNATTHAEVSEGDFLVDLLTIEATYEGEYIGQQISGVPIKFIQAETMRIVDGKIVEWWVEFDRLRMAEQLGFELQPK